MSGAGDDVSGRPHLSIGEVLGLLQDDFPDITLSKIRVLESQGLLDPERTPSGYRKFYEPDVARLRWVLEQQREHFLPLEGIRERIQPCASSSAPPPAVEVGAVGAPAASVALEDPPQAPAAEPEQDPIAP